MASSIIHYSECPGCDSSAIREVLEVKDHSVSGEIFQIWECADCTLRFTQDVPDLNSIGRYYQSADYISHSNTRTGLVNQLYHRVRKRTLEQKRKLLIRETGRERGSLLDIGAGVGAFAAYMKKAGWQVTALEPDPETRKRALELYQLHSATNDELFTLPASSFDAITMWHVLEHVHDLHGYLEKIYQLLKPGGKFFIAVPNYTSFDAKKYGSWWAAYDVPIHLYHFSPSSLQQILKGHRFDLHAVLPMWFDSFYVSMLSEKYKLGKDNLPGGFITGLRSNLAALKSRNECSSLTYIAGK